MARSTELARYQVAMHVGFSSSYQHAGWPPGVDRGGSVCSWRRRCTCMRGAVVLNKTARARMMDRRKTISAVPGPPPARDWTYCWLAAESGPCRCADHTCARPPATAISLCKISLRTGPEGVCVCIYVHLLSPFPEPEGRSHARSIYPIPATPFPLGRSRLLYPRKKNENPLTKN